MPAAPLPPIAVIVPPLMVMVPQASLNPAPIPAAPLFCVELASSVPVPLMVSVFSSPDNLLRYVEVERYGSIIVLTALCEHHCAANQDGGHHPSDKSFHIHHSFLIFLFKFRKLNLQVVKE
jgi:hypothetical protein